MKIHPLKALFQKSAQGMIIKAFGLLVSCQTFAATDSSLISLKSDGALAKKNDVQSFGTFCTAKREWIEIEGSKNIATQKKINSSIRREITVGKKLKATDCAGSSATETIAFNNRTTATASRAGALGVETFIHFSGSGRSGTHLKSCAVYSLTDGGRFDLGKYLTAAGKKLVAGLTCDTAKKDTPEAKQFCGTYDEIQSTLYYAYRFCLTDSGVRVSFGTANLADASIELSNEQIPAVFKLPKNLDLH